jgi:SAM-dependent methyltransferase
MPIFIKLARVQSSVALGVGMKTQSRQNQKGEIEFRKKLVKQQVNGEHFFENEYNSKGIEKILADRMKKTYEEILNLKEQNITFSPYIEIGAERCQRSLVMENDLCANGAAVDISFDMLTSCNHYKNIFGKTKIPIRICCDANNLPFKSNSIPFVFCYETLHHFPEPTPIVKQIYRVLSPGGHFFFNEEPYKKSLHLNLYNTSSLNLNKPAKRSKLRKIKNLSDAFFAKSVCNEDEYNIIENDNITIETWKRTLSVFEEKKVNLQSNTVRKNINTDLYHPKNYSKFLQAYLFGGEISGLCRKVGNTSNEKTSIENALICPSCSKQGNEARLTRKDTMLTCERCNTNYPIQNGVVFLFTPEKLEELYPEIAIKARR